MIDAKLAPAGPEMVLIEWRDAWFEFESPDPATSRPDYLVRTIGWLVAEDAEWYHVASEILPDGDGFRAVTHIPRDKAELTSLRRRRGTR